MPSSSPAQARLMRAVAHGWRKPGGGGPTESVAHEFMEEDMKRQHKMASMMECGCKDKKNCKC